MPSSDRHVVVVGAGAGGLAAAIDLARQGLPGTPLEGRAGPGGDVAAPFAAALYRMYDRYAAAQGWTVEPVSL